MRGQLVDAQGPAGGRQCPQVWPEIPAADRAETVATGLPQAVDAAAIATRRSGPDPIPPLNVKVVCVPTISGVADGMQARELGFFIA